MQVPNSPIDVAKSNYVALLMQSTELVKAFGCYSKSCLAFPQLRRVPILDYKVDCWGIEKVTRRLPCHDMAHLEDMKLNGLPFSAASLRHVLIATPSRLYWQRLAGWLLKRKQERDETAKSRLRQNRWNEDKSSQDVSQIFMISDPLQLADGGGKTDRRQSDRPKGRRLDSYR